MISLVREADEEMEASTLRTFDITHRQLHIITQTLIDMQQATQAETMIVGNKQ